MIKNIILDIGDVLVKSDYHQFFLSKGYDEVMTKRLEAATFFSPAWKELDRGVWSFEEIMNAFIGNDPEIEPALRSVFEDTGGFITAFPYAEDWIRELQAEEMKVYCLSNLSDLIFNGCRSELTFLNHVDGKILSWQERMVKPDPAIYRLMLERYQLRPEECIFVDDLEKNVAAAMSLGMHGVVFRNHEQAVQQIYEIRREAL